MKKTIFYTILIVFFAGLATLVYGFYNASNMRQYASNMQAVMIQNNVESENEAIEEAYLTGGSKNSAQLKEESVAFEEHLSAKINAVQSAQKEIVGLDSPGTAQPTSKLITEYYLKNEEQLKALEGIVAYMNQLFEVAIIFDKIGESATLEDMKTVLEVAKAKCDEVEPALLPEEISAKGGELKNEMDSFTSVMTVIVNNPGESDSNLTDAYQKFSEKEREFFSVAKTYMDSMEDLAPLKTRIDTELSSMQQIYFKVK